MRNACFLSLLRIRFIQISSNEESPGLSFFSVDVLPGLLDDDFMKIILSPAKKMVPEDTVPYRGLPCFIEEAEYLRDLMKQMDREQLKVKLREVLRHEFRHHIENLAGERGLEIEDEKFINKYLGKE